MTPEEMELQVMTPAMDQVALMMEWIMALMMEWIMALMAMLLLQLLQLLQVLMGLLGMAFPECSNTTRRGAPGTARVATGT